MIDQGSGGCIINIASASAAKADREESAYCASKAAVVGFTRVLALELGPYGIRANAILPGATETEMLRDLFDQVPGIREELAGQDCRWARWPPRAISQSGRVPGFRSGQPRDG